MMTTGKEARADQKTTIERLLNDEQVLVHMNPAFPGVSIPAHLAENKTVTLRLSRYFKGELTTDNDKITADLLFGSAYITCVIPWLSIWGASSIHGDEYVWREAAPEEIVHLLKDHADHERPQKSKTNPPQRHSQTPRTNPGHLRRVK